ncbi:AraC family transcriptional regulator [Marinobacter sp. C2H3]|uniref:AraC family transcriptional regulator n=1 Tax=Marinobacter sp. C2H3 TaxID=3119003 RepID=UPI00300EF178
MAESLNPTQPAPQPRARQRPSLGDISTLYVAVLLRAAAAEGANADALATQFRVDERALVSPEARISIPRFMRLGHAAIAETGNPALGLRSGALTRPVDAGIAGLAAETAATAGQALSTLIRFSLLTSQNSRGLPSVNPGQRVARFYSIQPYNEYNRFVVDSVLAGWTQMLRTVTGRFDVLERVTMEYSSIGLDEVFERWFRCPVEFGSPENTLVIRESIWQHPCQMAQPAMHEHLVRWCEQALERLQKGWRTSDRVRHLITPMLRGQTPTLETIASRLGTTPWTLQRHLNEEGTCFRDLLDDTRRSLAADYLSETGSSLSEIAWLLGFANPPAFHKAFQRWYGMSPGEFRKQPIS